MQSLLKISLIVFIIAMFASKASAQSNKSKNYYYQKYKYQNFKGDKLKAEKKDKNAIKAHPKTQISSNDKNKHLVTNIKKANAVKNKKEKEYRVGK